MLQFNKLINGIQFNVSFIDKINVIRGNSGTGKTFLFDVLSSYCVSNKIPYAYIDYNFLATGDIDLIYQHCQNKEIIILDNADLYLTSDLFNLLLQTNGMIIMSKKSTFGLDMTGAHLYTVSYDNHNLVTRRV